MKTKPEYFEEYDGYEMPEPHELSEEEKQEIEEKIKALREKIKKANETTE